MTVKDIAKLGKMLAQFLIRFEDCFARPAGGALLNVYVRGLLSDVQQKNAEAIALDQNVAPRTLHTPFIALVDVTGAVSNCEGNYSGRSHRRRFATDFTECWMWIGQSRLPNNSSEKNTR